MGSPPILCLTAHQAPPSLTSTSRPFSFYQPATPSTISSVNTDLQKEGPAPAWPNLPLQTPRVSWALSVALPNVTASYEGDLRLPHWTVSSLHPGLTSAHTPTCPEPGQGLLQHSPPTECPSLPPTGLVIFSPHPFPIK